jgi:tRNA threonylcarbamoyladenosine biosynthesis protein TsaE
VPATAFQSIDGAGLRMPLTLTLVDPEATERLGARVADRVGPGDVVAIAGSLGTGKTTLARAIIGALARRDGRTIEEVPSPTFTLVQIYEFSGATVHHFDLYRLRRPDEAIELGIEDAFASGISLIEWPERLGALLPRDRLEIALRLGQAPSERVAVLHGHGTWARRIEGLVDD